MDLKEMLSEQNVGLVDGEDLLEFAIFPDPGTFEVADCNAAEEEAVQMGLEQLRVACLDIVWPHVKEYIWQKDPFRLQIADEGGGVDFWKPLQTADDGTIFTVTDAVSSNGAAMSNVAHLYGRMHVGENIEDEWFVVFLLLDITCQLPNVTAAVRDSDGEFLLIEAAYAIPRWLKPANSPNRIFLREGLLHIVPRPRSPADVDVFPPNPTLAQALDAVRRAPERSAASDAVQDAIRLRVGEYPLRAARAMHHARCIVPLSVALVLEEEPQLVAPAVEAFVGRDVEGMKAVAKMTKFLPRSSLEAEGRPAMAEMVEVLVTFSRHMYAQLFQQVFRAPRCYPMPPTSSPSVHAAEIGMKLACGFEILYDTRARYGSSEAGPGPGSEAVGEARTRPGVVAGDPGWEVFRRSLEASGYFRGLLEGSRVHMELLKTALERYCNTRTFSRVSEAMHAPARRIDAILESRASAVADDFLPPEALLEGDDDAWMFSGEADLASELAKRQAEVDSYEARRGTRKMAEDDRHPFDPEGVKRSSDGSASADVADADMGVTRNGNGCTSADVADADMAADVADADMAADVDSDFDPAAMVGRMHEFMDRLSTHEGAEVPRDGEPQPLGVPQPHTAGSVEEREVQLSSDKFFDNLRTALGLVLDRDLGPFWRDSHGRSVEEGEGGSSDDSEVESMSSDSEEGAPSDEMNEPSTNGIATGEGEPGPSTNRSAFMEEYMEAMAEEMLNSTLKGSFVSGSDATVSCGVGGSAGSVSAGANGTNGKGVMHQVPVSRGSGGGAAGSEDGGRVEDKAGLEEVEPLNVDLNLVKSLLDSYNAQQGLPGPASNLMGMMGLRIPDDADDKRPLKDAKGGPKVR